MSTIYDWSLRASENTRADDLVDWSEGQLPSTINNSARGMMQRVREYLADTGGAIESTFTVNQAQQTTAIRLQTKSQFLEYKKDIVVRFKAKGRNVGITTVALNTLAGKQVYKVTEAGIALLSGDEMQQGCIYTLVYDEVISGWQLLNPTPTKSQLGLTSNPYPSGFIGSFAMQALPSGWLLCDGSAYSRRSYSDLFAAIGTTWGNGDGVTTFNIPDLRGMFLRGFDGGGTVDPGRAFASVQQDFIQSHRHEGHELFPKHLNETGMEHWHGDATMLWGHLLDEEKQSAVEAVTGIRRENMQAYDILAVPLDQYYTHHIATLRDGESETRPINVTVVFAIKS
ncbi:hypothetical protein HNQ69_001576 [Bartonella callosciuri]|uniref:Phage tail collar domain-containing protein n=1 Tax=Bartonella callosciuri TaxID=686223 RepID=A0A840NSF3_9HYPH|nr:phage tail protein [Bartonella callosciuri]MBB5074434.1 hypothetical protein [Bartonella callosciuri]